MNRYSKKLLVVALALLLVQIIAQVLQSSLTSIPYTISYGLETFLIIIVVIACIIQIKYFEIISASVLMFYSFLNLIFALNANLSNKTGVVYSFEINLLYRVSVLIFASALMISAMLFLMHLIQRKFDTKFTKMLFLGLNVFGLIFLIVVSVLTTSSSMIHIVKLTSYLVAMALFIFVNYLMISDYKYFDKKSLEEKTVIQNDQKTSALESLYQKGLITKEEYEARLNK